MKLNTKKYYFLPFLDNIWAVLISLLLIMLFGSWLTYKPFGFAMGIALTLIMCGFIYSRMWKLSRKNTQYNLGLTQSDGLKFVLPLVIFHLLLILYFMLAEAGIVTLKEEIIKIYYTFPDNLPREAVYISSFDYLMVFARFWFAYFISFSQNTHSVLLLLAPVLVLASGSLGFKLGTENKEMLNGYMKASKKIKDKFNE